CYVVRRHLLPFPTRRSSDLVLANILLELVSLVLQLSHLFLDLLDPFPVFFRDRLKQGHQVGGAFVGLGHVLLHRADGRAPEQADEWIDWHREYPGFRRRQVYGQAITPATV